MLSILLFSCRPCVSRRLIPAHLARLLRQYQNVHAHMHSAARPLKIYYKASPDETLLGWVGPAAVAASIVAAPLAVCWPFAGSSLAVCWPFTGRLLTVAPLPLPDHIWIRVVCRFQPAGDKDWRHQRGAGPYPLDEEGGERPLYPQPADILRGRAVALRGINDLWRC